MMTQRAFKIVGFVALLQLVAVTALSFVERFGGWAAAMQAFGGEWARLIFGVQITAVTDPVVAALVGLALLVIFTLAFGVQTGVLAGLLWLVATVRQGSIVERVAAECQLLVGRLRWRWQERRAISRLGENDVGGIYRHHHEDELDRNERRDYRAFNEVSSYD